MGKNDCSTKWDISRKDLRKFIEQVSLGTMCGSRALAYMDRVNIQIDYPGQRSTIVNAHIRRHMAMP